MKKLFYIIILMVVSISAQSQLKRNNLNLISYEYEKRLRFGFSLGVNAFDFTTVNTMQTVNINGALHRLRADVTTQRTGFDINGIIDYRLSPQFNLRALPGISFGSRNLDFYDDDTGELLHTMEINSNYVDVPLHLKFSAKRHSNVRPYVFGGANARYNLSPTSNVEKGIYFGTQRVEYFGEFGFGFDFYLPYFKFSIEAKFSAGLTNVVKNNSEPGYEAYRNAIDKMNSNMFMIKLHFE